MTVTDFEDLIIYQSARALAKDIYAITNTRDFQKDYRFCQQIHASVGSIADNIAEGFERQGNKEFVNFLYIAKGSCGELRSQLNRAYDVNFIDKPTYDRLYAECKKVSSSIIHFIQSIRESAHKGTRYDKPTPPTPLNTSEHF